MANFNTEDFTFPTSTDIFSISAIDSPPLWHLSPDHHHAIHPQNYDNKDSDDDQEEDFKDCFATILTLSLPCEEEVLCSENEDDGEKMDMLWENFNEELTTESNSSKTEIVNIDCIQALRMSSNKTTSGAVVAPSRKPSAGFVALVKVLRKLFLIHHSSHRSVKSRKSLSVPPKTTSFTGNI